VEICWDSLESVDWTQFEQEVEDLQRAKYAQDHADIVPVETKEEQRHRKNFCRKIGLQRLL
jgi:adenosine/AMP kinase